MKMTKDELEALATAIECCAWSKPDTELMHKAATAIRELSKELELASREVRISHRELDAMGECVCYFCYEPSSEPDTPDFIWDERHTNEN